MSSENNSKNYFAGEWAGGLDIGDVAIVGMAGRFPGARDIDAFWKNVRDGVESVSFFTEEDLIDAGAPLGMVRDPNYVRACVVLDDIDMFDAPFFDMTPREAEIIDPQQRLFLECAWTALEDAGYDPAQYGGAIGVYGGVGVNMYAFNLQSGCELLRTVGRMQAVIANDKDFLTTRVAYKLNLRGPSVTIQTACSTSLVAVHMAAHAVQTGQCDMALAGGCSIALEQNRGYLYQEGGVFSPDGHCRAFDANARGFICGSGVGIVVVKRLRDAMADGDHIYAVIRGSAVNNDGSGKLGFTAPSVEGQARVIAMALSRARVHPATVSYVETHGTGTALGDPVEIAALTEAFRAATDRKQFCAIGSVKTNVGHLDAAAGVVGLIKTAMALTHAQIPPTLHFKTPNPQIDFGTSPFYVNTTLKDWECGSGIRRAAVSSLGLGGTNAHVVLEEAQEPMTVQPRAPDHAHQLLLLSARTSEALEAATTNLIVHLKRAPHINCADVAHTLQVGRQAMRYRRFVVSTNALDAVRRFETGIGVRTAVVHPDRPTSLVVFMFPGGGSQHANMGRELYMSEEIFQQAVDACAELLQPHLGKDIRSVVYPSVDQHAIAEVYLETGTLGLSALFTIEYALARQWMHWGVVPSAMIGHSLGEYVAACLAGVLSLPDALAVVAARGRLFDELPAGAMISVALAPEDMERLLEPGVSLAAVNGSSACVVSGPVSAVSKLERLLSEQNVVSKRLNISVAGHSEMVTPILNSFSNIVKRVQLNAPRIPYISNVTGTWITASEATNPEYWARHLRQTVRFYDGVKELLRNDSAVMLEVGPGQGLSSVTRRCAGTDRATSVVSSLPHPEDTESAAACFTGALGLLWLCGVQVDWHRYARNGQRRVRLPTYPFERQRYWIEGNTSSAVLRNEDPNLIPRNPNVREWFHVPYWRVCTPLTRGVSDKKKSVLVFTLGCGVDERAVERLRMDGHDVITVLLGDQYERRGPSEYVIDNRSQSDYIRLITSIQADRVLLTAILHCWTLRPGRTFQESQDRGYFSLLFLAQALDQSPAREILLLVVSSQLFDVSGGETRCPEQSTVLGPCQVIPQEYLNIVCRVIDIALPVPGSPQEARLVTQLCAELDSRSLEWAIAYRGATRLAQDYQRLCFDNLKSTNTGLRVCGVYLITGGLGNVALQIAEGLARTIQARLVLVTRSPFPSESMWAAYDNGNAPDLVARTVRHIRRLQAHGSEVMVVTADVADERQMQSVLARIIDRFETIHGVFHTAGVTKGESVLNPISKITVAQSEEQFRPKVHGLEVLERVLQGHSVDFCLLFSSNASVLGGLGLVAYSAANHFMDAFAATKAALASGPWISASWDGWPMAHQPIGETFTTSIERFAMTRDESFEAVQYLLARRQLGHVVVSAGDLNRRLDLWVRRRFADASNSQPSVESRHERPSLRTRFVPPENDIQKAIANVWQQVFGIKTVGVEDNFFELGGNSLSATQVVSRLGESLGIQLPLRFVFMHPTITGLAAAVAMLKDTASPSSTLASMVIPKATPIALHESVGQVDQLTDEQVGRTATAFFPPQPTAARQTRGRE